MRTACSQPLWRAWLHKKSLQCNICPMVTTDQVKPTASEQRCLGLEHVIWSFWIRQKQPFSYSNVRRAFSKIGPGIWSKFRNYCLPGCSFYLRADADIMHYCAWPQIRNLRKDSEHVDTQIESFNTDKFGEWFGSPNLAKIRIRHRIIVTLETQTSAWTCSRLQTTRYSGYVRICLV